MGQDRMLRAPAAQGRRYAEANAALGGELEGVRQQVFQHLLQTLRVGDDAAAEIGIDIDVERQVPVVRLVPERASHGVQQIGGQYFLGIDGDGSGFDLGE